MAGIWTLLSRHIYFALFLVFLASIHASRLVPGNGMTLWPVLLVLPLLFGLFVLSFWLRTLSRGFRMALFLLLIAAGGFAYSTYVRQLASSSPLVIFEGEDVEAIGLVDTVPRLSENGISFFMRVTEMSTSKVVLRERRGLGRVYVYVRGGRDLPVSYQYRIRLRGQFQRAAESRNRGGFSMRAYLEPFGVTHEIVAPAETFIEQAEPEGAWARFLYHLRKELTDRASAALNSPQREVFLGLLIGDSVIYFPRELKETFRAAGLTHLLVVSGSQVSLLFLLVSLLFLRMESPLTPAGRIINILKYSAIFTVIMTYAVLTGFEPSIRRAFVISILVLIAHYLYYETEGLNLLGQAGIILLLIKPYEAFSVSFQLTFAATLGLILALKVFYPHFGRFHRRWRGILAVLAGTAGAQLMVFPLLIYYFNQFSPWGLLSNLVAIPLASLVVLLGVAFYLLGYIPILGAGVILCIRLLVSALHYWAGLFSWLPGADLHFVPLSGWTVVLLMTIIMLAFAAFGWGQSRTEKLSALLHLSLILLVLTICAVVYSRALPQYRVLYTSYGAASALVDRDRSATLFVCLPPTAERQASLLSNAYWLLVHEGASGISTLVILEGEPVEGLWSSAPFTPGVMLNSANGEVLAAGNAAVSSRLDSVAGADGSLSLWMVSLSRQARVFIPPVAQMQQRLASTSAPDGILGEIRIMVLPGYAARGKLSAVRSFLESNDLHTIVLQGRGEVPGSLQHYSSRVVLLTQQEMRGIAFSARGEVMP